MSRYVLYAAATATLLSTHGDYYAALDAADKYTLAMLAISADWVTVETWIVGPGVDGPLTVHRVTTHIGPPDDLDSCRRWSVEIRCRTRHEAL